jgi:hypothetical protein
LTTINNFDILLPGGEIVNEKRYKRLCDTLEDEQCKLGLFEKMYEDDLILSNGKINVQLSCSEAEYVLYHVIDVKQKKIEFIKKQLKMEESK